MSILAFTNQKGGVGKTSLCWTTAVYMSDLYKKKTLVIDLDTQGNISHTLIKGSENDTPYDMLTYEGTQTCDLFDPLFDVHNASIMKATYDLDLIYTRPNDLTLTRYVYQSVDDDGPDASIADNLNAFIANVAELGKMYEYVFIDCPPFLGQHILAALLVCDHVITPVQPTSFVIDGTKSFFDNLQYINREHIFLGMVLNNVDRKWVRHISMAAVLREKLGEMVFDSVIFHRAPLDAAVYLNKALYLSPQWRTCALEVDGFIREIMKRIDAQTGSNTVLEYKLK